MNIALLFAFSFVFQNCFLFLSMWICFFSLIYCLFFPMTLFFPESWTMVSTGFTANSGPGTRWSIMQVLNWVHWYTFLCIYFFWDTVPVHELWQVPLLPSARLGILDILLLFCDPRPMHLGLFVGYLKLFVRWILGHM